MPLDPVTWIDAALVSVTVRVTVCPEEMLLELALIETVGTAAAALVAKTETATKVRYGAGKGINFKGACLRVGSRMPDCALEGEVVPGLECVRPIRYEGGRIQRLLMQAECAKEATQI